MSRQNQMKPARGPRQRRETINPAGRERRIVTIETPAHLGHGLGRVDGKVWMIPMTAVGDKVEAIIERDHGSWVLGRLTALLEPGPGRTEPFCPAFGRCGGCHLQHLDRETQKSFKLKVLTDVLRRIGGIDQLEFDCISGSDRGCRCRVSMHAAGFGAGRDAGFFEAGSHRIVPPGECPVSMRPVAAVLEPVRRAVISIGGNTRADIEPVCGADGRCVVVLDQDEGDQMELHHAIGSIDGVSGVLSRGGRRQWMTTGDTTISWPTAGNPGEIVMLNVDPRGFTQAHMELNPILVETVISHAGRPVRGRKVLELYAGAGNMTIPLAMRGATVTATDINGPATQTGAAACTEMGLDTIHMAGPVRTVLDSLAADGYAPDLIVADPPRTGLGPEAARIAAIGAESVVICSCEPSALARDLRPFINAGYAIRKATLIDMFPQTYHMEAVISLTFNRLCAESRFRSKAAERSD